jgi:Na+(H+)/acetate symporter ActP
MFSDYFRGDAIRILTVLVALLFSIPYLGVQLGASGFLFNVLTDDLISNNLGMWILSLVVLVYVASGGLRAVAYVASGSLCGYAAMYPPGAGYHHYRVHRARSGRRLGSAQ